MLFYEWALEMLQIHAEKTTGSPLGIQRNGTATTKQINFRLIRLTTSFWCWKIAYKKCYYHYRPFRDSYESFYSMFKCRGAGQHRHFICPGKEIKIQDPTILSDPWICVREGESLNISRLNCSQFKYCCTSPYETTKWHAILHFDFSYTNKAQCGNADKQTL